LFGLDIIYLAFNCYLIICSLLGFSLRHLFSKFNPCIKPYRKAKFARHKPIAHGAFALRQCSQPLNFALRPGVSPESPVNLYACKLLASRQTSPYMVFAKRGLSGDCFRVCSKLRFASFSTHFANTRAVTCYFKTAAFHLRAGRTKSH